MLQPFLVTLSNGFLPCGLCFSIHQMGRRLDEITANFPSGFDTVFQNSPERNGLPLGTPPVVWSQAPSLCHQLLSCARGEAAGSCSIRRGEAESDATVILNTLKFQAESSFGA